jgi:hypothetical protein
MGRVRTAIYQKSTHGRDVDDCCNSSGVRGLLQPHASHAIGFGRLFERRLTFAGCRVKMRTRGSEAEQELG